MNYLRYVLIVLGPDQLFRFVIMQKLWFCDILISNRHIFFILRVYDSSNTRSSAKTCLHHLPFE